MMSLTSFYCYRGPCSMHVRNTVTLLTSRTAVNRLTVFLGAINWSKNMGGLNNSTGLFACVTLTIWPNYICATCPVMLLYRTGPVLSLSHAVCAIKANAQPVAG